MLPAHRSERTSRQGEHVFDTFPRIRRSFVCVYLPRTDLAVDQSQLHVSSPNPPLLSTPLRSTVTLFDCQLCSTVRPARPSAPRAPNLLMKTWTTTEEYDWLAERFPRWLKRRENKEKGFVKRTTADFLVAFPARRNIRSKMPSVSTSFVPAYIAANSSIENSTMVPLLREKAEPAHQTHPSFHPLYQTPVKNCSPHACPSVFALVLPERLPSSKGDTGGMGALRSW